MYLVSVSGFFLFFFFTCSQEKLTNITDMKSKTDNFCVWIYNMRFYHWYKPLYPDLFPGTLSGVVANVLNCEIAIIIIIMLSYQYGYFWPSLAIPPYPPLLPAGLQGYIPYLHKATVYRFKLVVLPLLGYVKGFTEVPHLWARPYFSSSVPHTWFV